MSAVSSCSELCRRLSPRLQWQWLLPDNKKLVFVGFTGQFLLSFYTHSLKMHPAAPRPLLPSMASWHRGVCCYRHMWREQVNLAWTTLWFYEPHAIWVIGKKMQVVKISLHIVPQVTSVHRTISSQASQTTWVQHWLHGNKKPGDQLMCFQQCRLPRYQPCSDPESVPVQTDEHWGRLQERHFLLYENSFLKVAEYILLSVVISSVIQSIKYLKTAP